MPLPLITDWHFYAFAIPAVLLLGISKSGFGAGFGSLAVPLMAMSVSVPKAAASLMPLLLVMDLMGIHAFRRHVDWPLFRRLIPWALLGTVIGTVLFGYLSAPVVAGIVGILTLLFLAQRLLFPPRADSPAPPHWLGHLLTTTSGFTSFVAHAGGPPLNAYVIPLRLPPLLFTGTMAYMFFIINLSKWVPYGFLGLLNWENLGTSLALLPFAPIGVFIGVRIAHRIDPLWFYRLVYAGMFLTGCKLVWDGAKHLIG